MTLYLDSSALLKRYVDEPDSHEARAVLESDPDWVTGRHTSIEVRRNLAKRLTSPEANEALRGFARDWDSLVVIELDPPTCELAASLAEATGARTLDALHLGAAQRVGGGSVPFVTYDGRLGAVARSLGWTVLGI